MINLKIIPLTISSECGDCRSMFLNALGVNFPEFAMYVAARQEFSFVNDITPEREALLQPYIDNYTCIQGETDYTETTTDSSFLHIIRTRNPGINENLGTELLWLNKVTGELFTCMDSTTDKNVWRGTGSSGSVRPVPPANKFDFFDDGTTLSCYHMNGNSLDAGGKYPGKDSGITYIAGLDGECAKSSSKGTIEIKDIPINDNTPAVTIACWMKWNGSSSTMPFGFKDTSLYTYRGDIGFYTSSNDLTGFNFSEYQNKWVYSIVVFKRDTLGSIYLDGDVQSLGSIKGSFNTTKSKVDNKFNIFGMTSSKNYRDFGCIERLRIITREITSEEARLMTESEHNFINSIGGL